MGSITPIAQQATLDHSDLLYRYARALSRHPQDAEDLVQETYSRALRAGIPDRPAEQLKAWLLAILRNAWLNTLRQRRRGPEWVGLDNDQAALHPTPEHDPQMALIASLERDALRRAVQTLPLTQREVVMLRDFEGLSYREIAAILGCPAGTVMSRLARARNQLKAQLEPRDGRPAQHEVGHRPAACLSAS
ncbi:RNA polymerase sigma factor [Methylogaea oryzae]|uniref:Sigma-70 family RNA polymerase sigma factor n=1 Tax=Methylogaea oryzae TaxID=1295382 RepID=A0A8D4VU94_9GAMM|nr:RNA polymerase sigma factor [Methylogaea oryzae]BBL72762.1 hypothetical protein MoryE10_33680 [Methylogaea oryzae]